MVQKFTMRGEVAEFKAHVLKPPPGNEKLGLCLTQRSSSAVLTHAEKLLVSS